MFQGYGEKERERGGEREMQSNVVAACNERFPVGWTVTLWMAGDLRPEGEGIRTLCHFCLQTNLNS